MSETREHVHYLKRFAGKEPMDVLETLRKECTFEVNCIYCGALVMYADPTHHIGQQLPDMICLSCKVKGTIR